VFIIVNEDTRQPVEDPVSKVRRTGTVVGLANHTVLRTKSGRELPIDDSAAPIRDAQGWMLGIVLVFRDISARRQAEQALQESRDQLAVILRGVAGTASPHKIPPGSYSTRTRRPLASSATRQPRRCCTPLCGQCHQVKR